MIAQRELGYGRKRAESKLLQQFAFETICSSCMKHVIQEEDYKVKLLFKFGLPHN